MSTFENDKSSVAEREQRGRNVNALRTWLQNAHPEIKPCMANDKIFVEYFDQSWGDADLSAADFEFALENTDITLVKQRVPTVAEENARRRAMSVPQLQQLAREERPVPQPDGLPQFYIPIGKKKEVELTAEVLRKAGTRTGDLSTADLKFLIRRYSAAEVNKRLGVKPTIQPGHIARVKI